MPVESLVMSARSKNDAEEQEGFTRGFHGIPSAEKLKAMSFAELASLLSSCEKDSPKFLVVDRELKKHLAKDQSEINIRNVILGACVGGIFGIVGVVIGSFLRVCPPPC